MDVPFAFETVKRIARERSRNAMSDGNRLNEFQSDERNYIKEFKNMYVQLKNLVLTAKQSIEKWDSAVEALCHFNSELSRLLTQYNRLMSDYDLNAARNDSDSIQHSIMEQQAIKAEISDVSQQKKATEARLNFLKTELIRIRQECIQYSSYFDLFNDRIKETYEKIKDYKRTVDQAYAVISSGLKNNPYWDHISSMIAAPEKQLNELFRIQKSLIDMAKNANHANELISQIIRNIDDRIGDAGSPKDYGAKKL